MSMRPTKNIWVGLAMYFLTKELKKKKKKESIKK